MKTSSFIAITFLVLLAMLPNVGAEDSSQWSLPENATARIGSGQIIDIAYSPDGKLLAVGTLIGTWLHDASTGEHLALLTGHTNEDFIGFSGNPPHDSTLSFSPDGKMLASPCWDGKVRIWNLQDRKLITTIKGYWRSALFSPDGKKLATGESLWNTHEFEQISSLARRNRGAKAFAFSPDGSILITGVGKEISLWDIKTEQRKTIDVGEKAFINSVVYSPDGTTLASGGMWDNSINLWNANTAEKKAILTGHKRIVKSVAYSQDGKLLASSCWDMIRLWDAETGQHRLTIPNPGALFTKIVFAPDGTSLTSVSANGKIQTWDVKTGRHKGVLTHVHNIYSMLPSPDGKNIATGLHGDLLLWNTNTQQPKSLFTVHTEYITPLLFSPDGKTLTCVKSNIEDVALLHYDMQTGQHKEAFALQLDNVYSRTLSPDGKKLALKIGHSTIQLWDTGTGKQIANMTKPEGMFSNMIFSPDNSLFVTGDNSGTIELWDAVTGQHKSVLTTLEGGTDSLVFSADGKILATTNGRETKLWNIETGAQNSSTFNVFEKMSGFFSLAFSTDGTIFASGSYDGKIHIWDTRTGLLMDTLIGHTGAIESLVFLPQQKNATATNVQSETTLTSRSRDGTVLLWEVRPYVETDTFIKITPPHIELPNVGEQMKVNIDIEKGKDVCGYNITMEFDETILRYISTENGNYLPSDTPVDVSLKPSWIREPNQIKIVKSDSPNSGKDGNGTLATVTFEVLEQKPSTITLPIARLQSQDGSLARPTVINSTMQKPTQVKAGPLNTTQVTLPEGVKARLGRGTIYDIKFSPDNTQLAVASSIGIWIYAVTTGKEQSLFTDNAAGTIKIAFSSDGKYIASSCSDRTVRVWNTINGQVLRTFDMSGMWNNNNSVSFSSDGRTLANDVELWDYHTGQHKGSLKWGHSDRVQAMAFSPDSKMLVTTTRRGNVRLWGTTSGKQIALLYQGVETTSQNPKVAFSSDSNKIAAIVSARNVANGSVMLWNTHTQELIKSVSQRNSSKIYLATDFAAVGDPIVVVKEGTKLYIQNIMTDENITIFEENDESVHIAEFSPDTSMLATAGNSGEIRIWDVATGKLDTTLTGHTRAVTSVAMSSDGTTLVTANRDQPMQLWDTLTLKNKRRIQVGRPPYSVSAVAFSPDETILASGTYEDVVLWDTDTLQKTATLKGHRGQIKNVVFSPDGRTLAAFGRYDKTIQLWNVTTGEEKIKLNGHAEKIFSLAFSPDGTLIATAETLSQEEYAIRLWDAETGENIAACVNIVNARSGRQLPVMAVAFSPDGKVVASLDLSTDIQLWDVETKKHKSTLNVNVMDIYSSYDENMDIAFSPDGTTLVSTGLGLVGRDLRSTINVWDVNTGKHQNALHGHTGQVTSLEYTADGTTLVSGSADGTALFWEMRTSPVTRMNIDPDTVESPLIGKQLTFHINITDAKSVNGYQFILKYDPTTLRYVSNPKIENNNTTLPVVEENTITFTGNASSGTTIKDGSIASVTFEVIKRTDVVLTITEAHLTHSDGSRSNPVVGRAKVVEPPRIPEDVNRDWQIDDADLEFVSSRLGQKGKDNPADVNKDGIVDIADLVLIRNALYGSETESETE